MALLIRLTITSLNSDPLPTVEGKAASSFLMLIFMFSLTGIPPTAGFIGKFYIFISLIHAHYAWLAVVAVIFSVISAYFYLKIVMYMYMKEPQVEHVLSSSLSLGMAVIAALFMVIFIGIFPQIFIEFAIISAPLIPH